MILPTWIGKVNLLEKKLPEDVLIRFHFLLKQRWMDVASECVWGDSFKKRQNERQRRRRKSDGTGDEKRLMVDMRKAHSRLVRERLDSFHFLLTLVGHNIFYSDDRSRRRIEIFLHVMGSMFQVKNQSNNYISKSSTYS